MSVEKCYKKYMYTIKMTYTKDDTAVVIKADKILNMVIDYDYTNKNMPIIIIKTALDKSLIDHMIDNKDKTIILEVSKYNEKSELKIYEKFIKDEFFYFLDYNKNNNDDLDYGNDTNKKNRDITKVITLGLISKNSVLLNKCKINTVYSDTHLLDIVCEKFAKHKLLIEPFDENTYIDNLIVTPTMSISKFLEYVNNEYCFYSAGYRFFYDFNRTYLLSNRGKAVPCKGEKYSSVYLYVNNTVTNAAKIEGMTEDAENKAYRVYIDADKVLTGEDKGSDLSYNKIIGVDSEGNTKTFDIDSEIDGDRYKITRISNNNLNKISAIQNNLNSSKIVLTVMKEQLDSEVFTMNKGYYLRNFENNRYKKRGRYMLTSKKEIYLRQTKTFQMTTVLTLKKCPSV